MKNSRVQIPGPCASLESSLLLSRSPMPHHLDFVLKRNSIRDLDDAVGDVGDTWRRNWMKTPDEKEPRAWEDLTSSESKKPSMIKMRNR